MEIKGSRHVRTLSHASPTRVWRLLLAALILTAFQNSGDRGDLRAQGPPCDIVCENAKTGNPQSEWDNIVGAGDPDIQGFATDISVNRGGTVRFKISSLTGYDIRIYRLGYYNGAGARKVGEILGLSGSVTQPACLTDPGTGLVDCGNWSETASWVTGTDMASASIPSGIFIAKLQRQGGGASHIPFVVRDDTATSDIIFQTADTTWQAYNRYGGGSLYCGGPISNAGTSYATPECPTRSAKVSYNRPIETRGNDPQSFLFNAEYPMVRWLEANGYKVEYWAGVDTDRSGAQLAVPGGANRPKIFLSVGHDEYWSGTQRTNVENARNAGVNLAFFSGNEVFWKTRWENSIDGSSTSHRTLVSFKESLTATEIDGLPNMWTGTWRDARFTPPADGGRPENSLTGTIWTVNSGTSAIQVPEPMGKLRLWRGIPGVADLAPGGVATLGVDTVGYEWDEDLDNGFRPAGLMRLSSTFVDPVQKVVDANGVVVGPGTATHNLTMYRHASGAFVFGAGTVQWSWGLDSTHDRGTPATHPADVKMQQATVNLFADMGNVDPVLPLGSPLVPADPSTDSGVPVSIIASPASGFMHAMSAPLFIQGTASDAAGRVAGVEVSTDNGVTWKRATGTTSWFYKWTPTAPGSHTIKSRAVDDSGNIETLLPSITVNVVSPSQAPGGPVLVVTSASNPFSSYYSEILRAEGLNVFDIADIGQVTTTMLTNFDVVILGAMPLSAGQVTMFSDWVTAGGNLIAMRPDKQLYGLLGLTDAAATLSNAYLLVSTQSAPGTGIFNQTMQFHGTADLATLNGAVTVATLYSDATTATTNPAVTVRVVGGNGGQAVAFLFDLAQSVVLTRQGNPAWAGQNRDQIDPVRSDDMFFGPYILDPQPNWIDFNKVDVPQADEQQRLLANTILYVNQDRKPLPRFWYFPRGNKAVVVMTGDEHGSGGSKQRFDAYINASAPGCSVNDWECIRATAYMYPNTPSFFPGEVDSYVAQGFEIALHPNTGCSNYTATSLDQDFATQLEALATAYPNMPPPRTNRTHCVVWSDYTTQADIELKHGIRFDTTYYYWPASWVADRPGFMTGSGMPMRFAKQTGEIIDVYQAATQETDESNQSFPFTMNTLLDNALGVKGYYGAFTTNVHGDGGTQDSALLGASIVDSAKTRNVPVVSAVQMLVWLDGRNNSSFGSITWNGTVLSFTVTQAQGANGLRGMLPYAAGGPLQQITKLGDPNPVSFTVETVKGVTYAFFSATPGAYQATYQPDTTGPVISGVSASALDAATAVASWTTDEISTSRVDYGTNPSSLNLNASDSALVLAHGVTLNNLTPNTTYYYRVSSVDFFGNSSTFPVLADPPLSFSTPPLLQSFLDTIVADFNAGTPDAGALVAQTADGEVMLKPTDGSEFFGTAIPPGWSSGIWGAGGSVTVSNGQLLLNNGWARKDTNYTAGRSLEFVANFGTDAFQHSGFAQNFNCGEPWAIFSTNGGTNQLYARTATAGCTTFIDTPLTGNWIGSLHRYRIDWNLTDVAYFIDGTEVARHTLTISPQMQILAASDFDEGGANPFLLAMDWERLTPYATPGIFLSRVFDAGAIVNWYSLEWSAGVPTGTGLTMDVRTGNTPIPDGTWSGFTTIGASGGLINATKRYSQYRATLSTTDPAVTPEIRSVTVNHAVGNPNTPPVAVDDSATTPEDTAYTFAASGPGSLTANDTDAETPSNQLTVIAVTTPSNGTAVLNPNGTVTYTPSLNFSGTATFTYTVSDGALTAVGNVTMTVSAVNDPPVAVADPSPTPGTYYQVNEDTVLTVPVATGVLANDSDVDNPQSSLTASVSTPPAHGTLTLNANGSFTYTPFANYSGPDGFFYRASDGSAQSAPAGVSILVNGVNDPPVANNDAYDVSRTGVPVSVTSIVLNGSTAQATTALQHGFATGHPVRIAGVDQSEYNGSFIVTATGPTTFSYTVSGTPVSPATGTITATAEDTTRTIAAPGVLGNDTDVEGSPLTATLGSTTPNGTLVFNSNGSFTYTPNGTFAGVDTFSYTVSDGSASSNTATVTINVHAEIATQTVGSGGGTVSTGTLSEGATPTDPVETSVTTPIAGTVTIIEGSISGTDPAPGYTFLGQQVNVTISTITDQNPLTDPGNPLVLTFTVDATQIGPNQTVNTVQIFRNGQSVPNCPAGPLTVNDYPCVSSRTTLAGGDFQFTVLTLAPSQWNAGVLLAGNASLTTLEDTTLNGSVASLSGHPNPASLTFAQVTGPAHGALTFNSNGSFAYTPALNYNGPDSFTYSVNDGHGGVAQGTVSIIVTPVNDAPSFTKGADQTVNEDSGPQTVNGWATEISPGANEANQTLTFVLTNDNAALFAAQPSIAPNGTLTYTSAANAHGSAAVTVRLQDNGGSANGGLDTSAPQTFTITINPVNDAPLAVDNGYSTAEDTALTIAAPGILGNDSDVEGNALTAVLVGGPASGMLTLNPNGSFTYTPNPNFNGTDSFTYRANDGTVDLSNVATVTITVTPVNDLPVAVNDAVTVAEDSGGTVIQVLTNDTTAPDTGETLTVTSVTQGANGSVANAGSTVSYTPNPNFFGSDSFTYTIGDGNGGSATATVSVTVTSVNDNPTAVNDSATVMQSSSANPINALANDSTIETGETLTISAVTQGTSGSVVITGGGTGVTYTPNAGFSGTDTFTYTITDGNGGTATATVTVTVLATPSITINDVSVVEGNSGTVDAVFDVTLSHAVIVPVTVNYQTVDGFARAGRDYIANFGTLTFAAGQTTRSVTVKVIGETTKEKNETFGVRLSDATNATIARINGIGTILDDDSTPTMTATTTSTSEGSSSGNGSSSTNGSSQTLATSTFESDISSPLSTSVETLQVSEVAQRTVVFTVTLTNPSEIPLSVAYQTVDGSAVAGLDYTPGSGTLEFGEDETVKTIEVAVNPDVLHELDEAFTLRFSNPIALIVANENARGLIVDDDPAPSVAVSDVSITEGNDGVSNAVFTVTLANVSGKPEMVTYTTVNGTAVGGSDYTAVSGTLTFAPGVTTLSVTVPVIGDRIVESNETFLLRLSAASDAPLSKAEGVATILDDDLLTWTTSSVAELQGGAIEAGSYLAATEDGEIILAPVVGDEFFGTTLASSWSVVGVGAGSATVGGGLARLDGRQINYQGLYDVGRSVEFVATFSADGDQYAGLGTLLTFTADNTGNLYAQTLAPKNNAIRMLIPGSWVGAPHRFRITWNPTNIVYSIDGVVVATHVATFPQTTRMTPLARDLTAGNGKLALDWVRLDPHATSGTYTSQVYDAGASASWQTASWLADVPVGTSVVIQVRSGDTPVPDASWSAFTVVPAPGAPIGTVGRYAQYRAVLTTTVTTVTPVLKEVAVTYTR